jgi:FkbM family methyltransferase
MMEWLGPLVLGPAKHAIRLARDPEYRTYCRLEASLGRSPRRRECRARAHGWNLAIPDAASFLISYREIFVDRTLAFPWSGAEPRILDLGSNIGLSVLAFKHAYPRARVTALEPDPRLFEVLRRNVHGNGFTDVELVPKAAWHEAARLPFFPDGADGGRAVATGVGSAAPGSAVAGGAVAGGAPGIGALEVDAIDVPALLRQEPFDFVKMDIEGAERAVIPASAGALGNVSFIFVEYHGISTERPALASVVGPLEEAGFRIQVHTVRSPAHPFLEADMTRDYNLILHIYGSRA